MNILPENCDPRNIYNIDETGLTNVPSTTQRVIAQKGSKNVATIQVGERGVLTTVISCISASGNLHPPFFVLKGERIAADFKNIVPESFGYASTKSGYIDKSSFVNFLIHFNKHRENKNMVAYIFLDGHSTHHCHETLTYCSANQIELICIPPHTSHRLQPLDTHFNAPLKRRWTRLISDFLREEKSLKINRYQFVPLLKKLWEMMHDRGLIVNAFEHTGIYPLKNTVKQAEYAKSLNFKANDVSNVCTRADVENARQVVPSSVKQFPMSIINHIIQELWILMKV